MSHIKDYILLFFFFGSFAQDLPTSNGPYIVFPKDDGFMFIEQGFEYFTSDGVSFEKRPHQYNLESYRFEHVATTSGPFFVSSGGGTVLRYQNDSLFRIDRSFEFQSRYGAYLFSKADTIYSLGGGGQFTNQNNLIYFTPKIREWLMEYRYDYRSEDNDLPLGQYDSLQQKLYFTLNPVKSIDGPAKFEVQGAIPTDVYSYDFKSKTISQTGSLKSILTSFFPEPTDPKARVFSDYTLPILYHGKEFWTFDFSKNRAFRHVDADLSTILQFEEILSYNPITNDFLLGHNLGISPRFLIVDESVLLGRTYTEYEISSPSKMPWQAWLFIIPLLGSLFIRRREVDVIERLPLIEKNLRQRLSEEDYRIYETIKNAYPEGVEYPDLQSSFERELSYESRIKKLRSTISLIDDELQLLLRRKGKTVFSIYKGKEDKRVKVIKIINDRDLKWTNILFSRRRG